jgi:hypothetical protein
MMDDGNLPCTHRLYAAMKKGTGEPVALVEAATEEQAANRLSQLLRASHCDVWDEVTVVVAESQLRGVPTYFESFFKANAGNERTQ